MLGTGGNLFGTTNAGGTNDRGVFFQVTVDGTVSIVSEFGATSGLRGQGERGPLLFASNGYFYGLTTEAQNGAGEAYTGTLYRLDSAGLLSEKLFTSTEGTLPVGGLTEAPGGLLYGVASHGGSSTLGTLFRYSLASTVLSSVYSFTGKAIDQFPLAGLCLTSDAKLLGTSYYRFFVFDPAFPKYLSLRPLGDASAAPSSPLILGANGDLFGIARSEFGRGIHPNIFKISSSGEISKVCDLGTVGVSGDNRESTCRLCRAADGALYGVSSGGLNSTGFIYRVSADGLATKYFDFPPSDSAGHGPQYPIGGLVQDSDGNFYGSTSLGGAAKCGTVFRLTPQKQFTSLVEFTGTSGTARGSFPATQLLIAGDGNIYGTTSGGGRRGAGTVFRLTPAGTLTILADFTFTGAVPGSGASPYDVPLLQATDGFIYGITENGGNYGQGTLFRITPSTGKFESLVQFSQFDVTAPGGGPSGLVQGADGNLYGTCQISRASGGATGAIFRYSPEGLLSSFIDFEVLPPFSGQSPTGLVAGADGALYGVVQGTNPDAGPEAALVFRADPAAVATQTPTAVLIGGDVPALPGATYASFGPPTTGASAGTYLEGRKKTSAVFAADGHVLLKVGGEAAPALPGSVILSLGIPNGDAVLARLKPGQGGVTARDATVLIAGLQSGAPRVAARSGTSFGDSSGATIRSFGAFDGQGTVTFFLATLQGGDATVKSDSALCAAFADGTTRVLVREGKSMVGGLAVTTITTLVPARGSPAEARWRTSPEALGVRLSFAGGSQAIFTVPASAHTPSDWIRWLGTGERLGDSTTGPQVLALGLPGFGADSLAHTLTFKADTTSAVTRKNDAALYREAAIGTVQVVREGESFPLAPGTANPIAFLDPVSGAGGALAFAATLAGSRPVPAILFAPEGGTLIRVAAGGQNAPGGGRFASFTSLVLPDGPTNGPVFTARLAVGVFGNVTAASATGLWAADRQGQLYLLARAGARYLVAGKSRTLKSFTTLTGTAGSLGAASGYDQQQIAISAVFTDKTKALLRLPLP